MTLGEFVKKKYNQFKESRGIKTRPLGSNLLFFYVTKELFLYFFVAFLFLFMVFFVNQILLIIQQLLENKAPFWSVMKIMFYSCPAIIAQSAPFATLVGFLMCLGRMNSDNEILIFRAAGFGFGKILFPVLASGLLISLVSFFVNDYLLPLGTIEYNKLFREIMQTTPTVQIEPNSVKKMDNFSIVTGDVNGDVVSDIVLFSSENGDEMKIISAGDSLLEGIKKEGLVMKLTMNDAIVIDIDNRHTSDADVISSEKIEYNVFDSVFGSYSSQDNPREMTSSDVYKRIQELRKNQSVSSRRLNIWNMEFYKKFSIPFASFCFALLALSIALIFGRHNGLTIGLIVGVVICVLYWAMQISGQLLVRRVNMNAFACIWFPNIIIFLIGVILYLRLLKK